MTHAFGFILVVIFGSQVFLQHASARDVDGAHMSLSTLEAPRDTEYTIQVQQVALEAKTTVDQALSEFNGKTLPHEAKDLRKQLVTLRDILDVFSHNFSTSSIFGTTFVSSSTKATLSLATTKICSMRTQRLLNRCSTTELQHTPTPTNSKIAEKKCWSGKKSILKSWAPRLKWKSYFPISSL